MATAVAGRIPTLFDIKKERYRRSFYAFAADFWGVAEPAFAFVPAKHIQALCDHSQAVYEGRIPRLNIEIGPGSAKSMTISVLFPAWIWGPAGNPGYRIISSTQEHGLTIRDSLRFRSLVYSPEYQEIWGDTVKPMADNNKQEYIENTAKGFRLSKSVTGKATGHRGHMNITDDTLDATAALSDSARERVTLHLRALSTRRLNPKAHAWINIGQRLHDDDAGGWARKNGFETLCLPTEYDPARKCRTSIGFEDWRTEKGELLCPQIFGPAEVAEAKSDLLDYGFSAQHQQLPTPAGGGVLKNDWWGDFNLAQAQPYHTKLQFWDTAYTSDEANDSSACTTWGISALSADLRDGKSFHFEAPDLIEQMKIEAQLHNPDYVVIEAKANGLSIIQTLHKDPDWRWRIIAVTPKLSKLQRAHAIAPYVAKGRARVPRSQAFSKDYLGQTDVFPYSKLRDLADSGISALLHVFSTYTFGEGLASPFYEPPPTKSAQQSSFNIRDAQEGNGEHDFFTNQTKTGLF